MAWNKNFTKIFISRQGTFVPPCPDGADIAYVQTGYIMKNGFTHEIFFD